MRAASRPSSAAAPAAAGLVVSQPFLLSSFIGREAELKRGVTLLGRHRLVTLTGTGGCGKTRLAVELAQRQLAAFSDGTWFVDLARVDRAEFILAGIAAAIGVDEPERNRSLADEIVRRLRDGRFLVVLDNCEHVIEAASTAAAMLLQGAVGLTILATSREPLSVPGEVIWTLPGLNPADAIELFAERATQARPDLVLDEGQRALIHRICRQLDGLPLAVELAAARTQALSVARIADSLDSHLALLGGAPRTAPARHATIRASFDWSYQLLETDERVLLAELSVFAGGFGLDDALAVCPDASVEAVARLVSRSMVALVAEPGEPRYRLPETIRQFAAAHLAEAPDLAAGTRQRHAEHYLALAEQAEPHLTRAAQDDWLERLAPEGDNLRAALAWTRDQADPVPCARLAMALAPYWLERSNWSECRFWLAAALQAGPLPPALEARVLNRRCYLEMWAGDLSIVPQLAMRSLSLLEGLDEPVEQGRAHGFLGVLIASTAGPDAARPHQEAALALTRAGGDDWGLAMALAFFGDASLFQARPGESRQMLDEAVAIATAAGDRRTLRIAQSFAALAAVTQGRLEEGIRRSRWAADEARATGHDTPLITALATRGWALLLQGHPADARAAAAESLDAARASEEGPVLEGLALWASAAVLADTDPAEALPMFDEAHRLTAPSLRFAALTSLAAAEARLACGDPGAADAAGQAERLAGLAGCAWLAGRARLVQAQLTADPAAAESAVHEGVALAQASGDVLGLINALELLAALAEARGDDQEALRLRGAAAAARARQSYAWTPPGTPGRSQPPSGRSQPPSGRSQPPSGRSQLPSGRDRASSAAWAEGEKLSIEAALAYASRGRGRRRRPASGWPSLTPTELEVVRLVARHQSNPEIAERLFVSRATVKTHLVHIFAKLGVRSRSELAAEAIRRGTVLPAPLRTPTDNGGHPDGVSVVVVATCQFPVSARIEANLGYVTRQVHAAKRRGADVAHFPEAALSGYAGTDFETFADFDWDALRQATAEVLRCAREAGIWVVLGSAHRLGDGHLPHNSLYVIDDAGQVVDRYDKRFCSGTPDGRSGDLAHYSPGDHASVWVINGVRCGALICYDYRFPELYREYKRQGVDLVFHSFHAGGIPAARVVEIGAAIGPEFARVNQAATHTYPGITMPAAMTAAAASNHVWISCPNSSAPQSLWPAFVVRADGITVGRLRRNVAGVLVTTVDTEQDLYDSTAAWRGRAMAGVLHSGTLVTDPRSADRTTV